MPVSRRVTEGQAVAMQRLYAGAELRLLRMMAKHLAAGVGAPDWQTAKMAELQLFRRRAEAIMGEATRDAVATLGGSLTDSYFAGTAAAQGELDDLGVDTDTPPRHAERAVANLAAAATSQLQDAGPQVLRATQDAYRDAVARASAGTLSGATTVRQDVQQVLDDLANRGITGFKDAKGRRWEMSAYAEMAVRTATAQAAVSGHLDRLEDAGLPLVIVSNSPRECDLCRPWEGKVLSRGPVAALQRDVTTGELVRVDVDGTVDEAMRDGLLHPNCTHSLSAYLPGATQRPADPGNAKGYAERQQLRAMERNVRKWKRREAVAITPEAKALASGKVRSWQARIRDHVGRTGLIRQRYREQIRTGRPGDAPGADPVDITNPPTAPTPPAAPALRDPSTMTEDELHAEMTQLMEAGDYGDRLEQLGDEFDRRDAEAQAAPVQLPADEPDPLAEADALNKLLYGDAEVGDLTSRRAGNRGSRDKQLRDEFEQWAWTEYVRCEDETRGHMLSADGHRAGFDPAAFFGVGRGRMASPAQVRKYASPEVLEWFGRNGRMSFDEFRAGQVDDKRSRDATRRMRERTLGEWG